MVSKNENTEDYGFEVSQGEQIYRQNCSTVTNLIAQVKSLVDTLVLFRLVPVIKKTNSRNYCQGRKHADSLNYQKNIQLLLDYLSKNDNKSKYQKVIRDKNNITYLPFGHTGYNKFLDKNGLPAISPPWGTLNALDLNTGEYLWQIPFGETDHLKNLGYPTTGTENYGGPVITENGLLFIAATKDGYIRAYNKETVLNFGNLNYQLLHCNTSNLLC